MRLVNYSLLVVIATIFFLSCSTGQEKNASSLEKNEEISKDQLVRLDSTKSDPKAIELAKKVIEAHGGIDRWNDTEYVAWNFFGARDLYWNKHTGDVKIITRNSKFNINLNEESGEISVNGKEIKEKDSIIYYTDRAKQIWVNDAYWMFFPFKLLDKGVLLAYHGQDTTLEGALAEKISLTFEMVGYTPQNKYFVYIEPENHKILQWDYFANASDSTAGFQLPWSGYIERKGMLFSTRRGEKALEIKEIGPLPSDSIFASR